MLVREMLPEDADAVASVHTHAWQRAYHGILDSGFLDSINVQKRANNWKNGILANDPPMIRLVAERDGNVIAFACGLENRSPALCPASDCELWALYTEPSEFRKGAGRSLLSEFKSRMKLMGKKQLCLWTLRDNPQARLFYEAQGGVLGHATKEIKIGEQLLSEVVYEFVI